MILEILKEISMQLQQSLFLNDIYSLIGAIIGLFCGYYIYKLYFYLRKNKSARFKRILGEGKFMYMGIKINPIHIPGYLLREHKYIFNDQDTKDGKINRYKKMLRIGTILAYVYIVSSIVLFVIIPNF